MSPRLATAPHNQLIALLPNRDRKRLLARCEPVELVLADVLFTSGEAMRHAFFPIDSVISLIVGVDDRDGLEVALIGDEGMLGISLLLGQPKAHLRAQVQGAGPAWRIEAAGLSEE